MGLSYKGSKGNTYTIGAKIKGGGEGTVYEVVGHQNKVAKIYLPKILSERKNLENKILAMIKQPVKNAIDSSGHVFICWPEEAIYDNSGFFCGFIMPKASSVTKLQLLYLSDTRKQKLPNFTWKVLLVIAFNLANAVNSVHAAGHIVGDFNPNNVLVDNNGKVTLIDVDSFDIKSDGNRYPCEVGVEDYLAPELQGKNMKHANFTEESDRFSLAIHIFQLLMDGNHPFHSAVKSNLNSKHTSPIAPHIANGECGYIKQSNSGEIPPGAPPYTMLPQKVRDSFLQVFSYTSALNSIVANRPTAYDWAMILLDVYNNQPTNTCTKIKNQIHVYPTTISYCPWCDCEQKKKIAHTNALAVIQPPGQPAIPKQNPFAPIFAPTAPTYSSPSRERGPLMAGLIGIGAFTGLIAGAIFASPFSNLTNSWVDIRVSSAVTIIAAIIVGGILGGIAAYFLGDKYESSSEPWIYYVFPGIALPFATVLAILLITIAIIIIVYVIIIGIVLAIIGAILGG